MLHWRRRGRCQTPVGSQETLFRAIQKDGARPPCIDLDTAIQGFNIDNTAAYQAIEDSKALHARRWQTKEGMYRIKRRLCLMYVTRLSTMTMQLPLAQMANRDGEPGMETMLWDISVIPNELDKGYLMLPPGVLHMSALGASNVSPSSHLAFHLPNTCRVLFVLCCVLGLGCLLLCRVFVSCFASVFGIPNSPRSLESAAM